MSSIFHEAKSSICFYQKSVIILSYFEILCNYPKRPQRTNYEIQGVNRFSKFYFTKIKTVGTPPLNHLNNFVAIFQMYFSFLVSWYILTWRCHPNVFPVNHLKWLWVWGIVYIVIWTLYPHNYSIHNMSMIWFKK